MPNSADKTSSLEETLDEDSDVIELTEEVGAGNATESDLDELGLAMPEFRVPSDSDSVKHLIQTAEIDATPASPTHADDDDGGSEDASLPGDEAHETKEPEEPALDEASDELEDAPLAESSDAAHDATVPEEDESLDDDDAGATQSLPTEMLEFEEDFKDEKLFDESPEAVFDREELVKTVRMEAFDRDQIELLDAVRSWEIQGYLDDQRYAPDVLVVPPRVLTKKWQDGARVQTNGALPGGPGGLNDRAALATTIQTTAARPEEIGEDDEEPIELEAAIIEEEAEQLEEVSTPRPPPRPAGPPPKQPAKQQPGRVRHSTGPMPRQQARPAASQSDDDLNGIVQELLEEKKVKKQPQKQQKQRTPEDEKRTNWFMDVFADEYLRTLPKDLHRQTERDVRFIIKSLGLQKGARVLDLACGFGRHSVELAQRDYEVAGLDISMPMLQRALNEAQRRNLSIKFIHGDMRDLNFNEIFDGCFCWQTSFGYFDDRTNLSVIRGMNRALKPGGRLLIDLVNRDYVIAEMPSRTWWEGVECVFLEEVEFDYETSVLHTKRSFIYEDGSPPQEFSSFVRLYSLHEISQLLRVGGFRMLEVSGELHHRGSFLGPASSRMIVLAEKRAAK